MAEQIVGDEILESVGLRQPKNRSRSCQPSLADEIAFALELPLTVQPKLRE
jgi:hypothetical protein